MRCPYCDEWHKHGSVDYKIGDVGSRESHCFESAPYDTRHTDNSAGYNFRVVGTASAAFMKRVRKKAYLSRPKNVYDGAEIALSNP
jgi:hypothetical protein